MHKAVRSALVSTQFLRDVVATKSSQHRILDAAWHMPNTGRNAAEEYKLQHIPGALFFDVDDCADKSTDLPHMIPSPEVFENYVGRLGIDNNTHVIVYDNNPQFPLFSAQRVWWTFRVFGHDKISVLNGGLQKWIAEKGDLTSEVEEVPPKQFRADFRSHLIRDYRAVERNIKESDFQLVDARPEGRFLGQQPEPRADTKSGCIPNTTSFPFASAMDLDKKAFKTPDELRSVFAEKGVDLTKPLAATCGSGMTACLVALAAFECGNDQVSVYDGSWTEWYRRAPDELKKNVPSD